MLLCEDILLLGTDDETGARRSTMGQLFELVIAGALLTDLTLAGQVRLTEPGEDVRRNRVVAVPDAGAPDDNLLLITRARLEQKRSWEMTYAVRVLQKNLVRLLYERLIAAEMITREDHMALGFIPYRRYPSVDGSHELGLLASIDGVLFEGKQADDHTAALISLLYAGDLLIPVVDRGRGIDRSLVKKYARSLLDTYWPAKATKKAIEAAQSS